MLSLIGLIIVIIGFIITDTEGELEHTFKKLVSIASSESKKQTYSPVAISKP